MQRGFLFLSVLLLLALAATACRIEEAPADTTLAPLREMSAAVQLAPERISTAYRAAVANEDALAHIPCYCGCAFLGHTSVDTCFVAERNEKGQALLFDEHALECNICVDIVLDARQMILDEVPPDEMRRIIDEKYSPFGPATPVD